MAARFNRCLSLALAFCKAISASRLTTALSVALACTVLVAPPALAVADGTIDAAFTTNTGTGADDFVYKIAVQANGKMILVGGFTHWGTVPVGRIVRLNADGTLDSTFTTGTGADNRVMWVTVQADGKILIGGSFTTWDGVAVNRIIRLHENGTIDPSFTTTGTGPDFEVRRILEQVGGKFLVAGGVRNPPTIKTLAGGHARRFDDAFVAAPRLDEAEIPMV